MRGRNLLCLLIAASLLPGVRAQTEADAGAAGPVVGKVEELGFPSAAGSTGRLIRAGQWFPVRVRLTMQGTGLYGRRLRLETRDLDGDRVAYLSPEITLASEGGQLSRRAWCYAVANALGELPRTIGVLDERERTVARLPLPQCDIVSSSDLVILDISDQRVSALDRLRSGAWTAGQQFAVHDYYRNVVIASMAARDLPDRWIGLEAADVIVWDLPNPEDLQRFSRIDALIDWVRNGGQLIVGVGANWDAIQANPALAEIMPMRGPGTRDQLVRPDVFLSNFAVKAWKQRELDSPIAVTTAELAPGAIRTLGEHGPRGSIHLIAMCPVGSGRVVTTAASLRDLTESVPVDQDAFFGALLDLNRHTQRFKDSQTNLLNTMIQQDKYIYDDVTTPIAFGTTTALFGLLALVFVGGYIAIATIGSWAWLRTRKLTQYSWTAFAVLAVAGGVLSLGAVRAISAFAGGVRSFSVIDLEQGASVGRGYCWFGYRSPNRKTIEMSLPAANPDNYLRPLARGGGKLPNFYVTPARYTARPTKATLDDVLVRATLKQVEGHWSGELPGTIRGDLTVSRRTGELSPTSWIRNDLPFDLDGGYLFFVDPRQGDDFGVPRAAGLTRPASVALSPALAARIDGEAPDVAPAWNILTVGVPRIPAGEQAARLGAKQYQDVAAAQSTWAARRRPKRAAMPTLLTLWHVQQHWCGNTAGPPLDPPVRQTLLASMYSYFLNCKYTTKMDFDNADDAVVTDGLPRLDISHWLLGGTRLGQRILPGQAVLICWTRDTGPARLHLKTGWQREPQPLAAYRGLTIYRVRIPINYQGNPP